MRSLEFQGFSIEIMKIDSISLKIQSDYNSFEHIKLPHYTVKVFELIWEVILYIIVDCIGEFAPKAGVWFWLALAVIVCVIIGLVIYFAH